MPAGQALGDAGADGLKSPMASKTQLDNRDAD